MAEEDRRKKLPKNWEAVQRRVEWENKEEEAKKVYIYIYIYANVFNCPFHTDIKNFYCWLSLIFFEAGNDQKMKVS